MLQKQIPIPFEKVILNLYTSLAELMGKEVFTNHEGLIEMGYREKVDTQT
jgi:hypothetical protein